jgi:hypothetical protein
MPPHLEEVFQLYEVPEDQWAEIIRYAAGHPGVAQALLEAIPELEKVFGNTRRRLELEVDPEGGWEQLLGMVLLKDYPENAFDTLSQFDRSWFLKVPSGVRLHLNFIVELEDDYPV